MSIPLEPIPFGDATQICVPNTLQLMTPYVLLEQEDWFEDEIKFVRKLIKPGMTLIDIGANYGVYTLSMAKCLENSGKLVAFEPTSAVADALRQSIALNGFNTVELRQCALSDHAGTATFHTNPNAELNSLHTESAGGSSETVQLATLDEEFPAGFPQVDFIKLDAEGEEGPIIKGGQQFFARQSPLIMYELKHGNQVNEALIGQFAAIGFKNFVLMPGLDVLVPFEVGQAIDGYQLNLFSCREDRAALLEQQGLLLRQAPAGIPAPVLAKAQDAFANLLAKQPALAEFPGNKNKSWDAVYLQALNLYAWSRTEAGSPAERAHALLEAHRLLGANPSSPLHALLRVRTSLAIGLRAQAVEMLQQLLNSFGAWGAAAANGPLLPASPRFESLSAGEDPVNWLFASLLEQYEKSGAFSSYFTGTQSFGLLNRFFELGFPSPELMRRISLMQARATQQTA